MKKPYAVAARSVIKEAVSIMEGSDDNLADARDHLKAALELLDKACQKPRGRKPKVESLE